MAKKKQHERRYKNPDEMKGATGMLIGVTKMAVVETAGMGMLGMLGGIK
jgi:hypothetical protein